MAEAGRESSDERFLRNHQENRHLMLLRAAEMERAGDHDSAERIRGIADAWEMIAEVTRIRGGIDERGRATTDEEGD